MASGGRLLGVTVLALLTASLLGPTASADWPHPRADAQNTGADGPLEPGNGSIRWTTSFSFTMLGPPAVAEDTVLAASDEVHALDASTGDERWSFRPSWDGFELPRGWLRGPPVTDGETVVVSTSYPSLHALALEDGHELWRLNTSARPSSLAIDGDHVYTVRDENVTAHRLSTGAEEWRFDAGTRLSGLTPVAETVYVATLSQEPGTNRVLALEASSGEPVWSRGIQAPTVGPPAVDDEAVYLGYRTPGDNDGGVLAVDRTDGRILWTVETEGAVTEPVTAGEDAILAVTKTETSERYASEQLEVLSPEDGRELWTVPSVSGPVALAGGIAYVGGETLQGFLVPDGDQARFFPSPPGRAQHVTVGGDLFLAWDGDALYAMDGGQVVHETSDVWTRGLLVALVGVSALALAVAMLLRERSPS